MLLLVVVGGLLVGVGGLLLKSLVLGWIRGRIGRHLLFISRKGSWIYVAFRVRDMELSV